MRLLFLGDIVGSAGREAVIRTVPRLRDELKLDYVIANGENCSGGKGLIPRHADELFAAGVDVITGGNHTFQHRELYPYLESTPGITRPLNYPPGAPGRGIAECGDLVVINLIGRAFMPAEYDDPFRAVDVALAGMPANRFIVVDFHAEATSEKQAMGWHLDGRATFVVGTHTHVPTADCRLLRYGTAYCTDAGMCGAKDSVIGDDIQAVLNRFLTQMPTRLVPAEGPAVINGVLVEADDRTRRAVRIERVDREVC
ncbi:TIGR00282 family metallophosphoesterase [Tepidiforma sp.]|jgi:metallophosphoesterase (TIGR00282 family)|uniref:TIGR00282 family metallophosphoesterase n=1 Tax=Tepidiforma sp. TaxID=2682230 RepID=UPI002623EE56|nr:TIGR00282 family metallophosphoesterase [Tepidiforma sp.]MCX7617440.1 TIGR00282 family metallophosphoesterase [Tepidiforma sp.]